MHRSPRFIGAGCILEYTINAILMLAKIEEMMFSSFYLCNFESYLNVIRQLTVEQVWLHCHIVSIIFFGKHFIHLIFNYISYHRTINRWAATLSNLLYSLVRLSFTDYFGTHFYLFI